MIIVSLLMAIIPALLLVIYYYRQDSKKPEPKGLIVKIFFFGIFSTLPAIAIELPLGQAEKFLTMVPFIFPLFKAFIIAALVEEWIKRLVVKKFAYNRVAFDEEMDGVVYAIIASLGFACLENVLYVMGGTMMIAVMRAFTAVPMHAFASGIMGLYIGKAKFSSSPGEEKKLMRKGLFIAVMIHGIYDFLLFAIPDMTKVAGELGALISLGIFPLLIWAFIKLKRGIKSAIDNDIAEGRV